MMTQSWNDYPKGVEVKPGGFDEVNIVYDGLLSRSGADLVFLHYGLGDPRSWSNVNTIRMDKSFKGWEKTIRLQNNQITFCFKDSASNWDNNNGFNWTIR
ncbi:MAG: carbohydrate-binding protein [Eubacteriales bacterium]|jgi:hypothetical protein